MTLTKEFIREITHMVDERSRLKDILAVLEIAKEKYTDKSGSTAIAVCGQSMVLFFENKILELEKKMSDKGIEL